MTVSFKLISHMTNFTCNDLLDTHMSRQFESEYLPVGQNVQYKFELCDS